MNKGTEIEKVIAYLEKRRDEGYTHVAVNTPDNKYASFVMYDECSRKDEGVLQICGTCVVCHNCDRFYQNGKEKNKDA